MSILDRIINAKEDDWLTADLSECELKQIKELAKISAWIEQTRIEKNFTQKEFAEYMNVTQGMISKWESGEYNFSINTLIEVFYKMNLQIDFRINKKSNSYDSAVLHFEAIQSKKLTGRFNLKNSKKTYKEIA